ncbi:hypothetical protein REPUB_Repub11eG0040500 [Reevesia pubescens]
MGPIPSNLGNLTESSFLDFSFNHFERKIPDAFRNLNNQSYLVFSGFLPSSAFNLTRLTYMALSHNLLEEEEEDQIDLGGAQRTVDLGEEMKWLVGADKQSVSQGRGSFLRIRVYVDVAKPFRHFVKHSRHKKCEIIWAKLRYERLPNFCYGYRKLGHIETDCDSGIGAIEAGNGDRKQYEEWLRVSPLKKCFLGFRSQSSSSNIDGWRHGSGPSIKKPSDDVRDDRSMNYTPDSEALSPGPTSPNECGNKAKEDLEYRSINTELNLKTSEPN